MIWRKFGTQLATYSWPCLTNTKTILSAPGFTSNCSVLMSFQVFQRCRPIANPRTNNVRSNIISRILILPVLGEFSSISCLGLRSVRQKPFLRQVMLAPTSSSGNAGESRPLLTPLDYLALPVLLHQNQSVRVNMWEKDCSTLYRMITTRPVRNFTYL
jgi:hypothetical protein